MRLATRATAGGGYQAGRELRLENAEHREAHHAHRRQGGHAHGGSGWATAGDASVAVAVLRPAGFNAPLTNQPERENCSTLAAPIQTPNPLKKRTSKAV